MSGIYWGLTAMDLIGQLEVMNKAEVLDYVRSCQHPCGGVSACLNHDAHLLHTLSAIQVQLCVLYLIYVWMFAFLYDIKALLGPPLCEHLEFC